MVLTLVTGFGDFLHHEYNSTQTVLDAIPTKENIVKKILPVGYFKRDFIKLIKQHQPQRVIFMGMHAAAKKPRFETVAMNKRITLKNTFYRKIITLYSYWLKWNNKNLRIKEPLPKEKLTVIPIKESKPPNIKLHTTPPRLKGIAISNDAGDYVCNYAMWVIEDYIKTNNLDIDFYFIHLPLQITSKQKQALLSFILKT